MNQPHPFSRSDRARPVETLLSSTLTGTSACPLPLLVALTLTLAASVSAESLFRPATAVPGGVDPRPFLTELHVTAEGMAVQWSGPMGPFLLQRSSSVAPSGWEDVGEPTFGTTAEVPMTGDQGFLRVVGEDPKYVGSTICKLCHGEVHATWGGTAHAKAMKTLEDIGQQNNAQCLACHSVGYGWAGGFQSNAATPKLADVQCENCHGPGIRHVENVDDLLSRPVATPAAEICGGCHNGFHHPTFDEWKHSMHGRMDEHVAESMVEQGEPRMKACGPCHSGSVRLALMKTLQDPAAPLPSPEDAAAFPVTCAVCHEAHDETGHPAQLRNPTFSTQNFSYSTAATTSFAAQYDPTVQMCGQCHNMRGARWQDTSRPPHHSPQYNVLVGKGAYDLGASLIATHGSEIQQQCAQCHTHPHESDPVTPANPNYTGHTFEVRFEGCTSSDAATACHPSADSAERFTASTQRTIKNRIAEVQGLLNQWATNQAPEALREKYGVLAWEYNTPGQLSNPSGDASLRGPSTTEQADVPAGIKQARMNLYLVEHDGSYGAHNGSYARHLLGVAKTNVLAEIAR